jgi:hypothetical protein
MSWAGIDALTRDGHSSGIVHSNLAVIAVSFCQNDSATQGSKCHGLVREGCPRAARLGEAAQPTPAVRDVALVHNLRVGFGRILASETEAPIILVNMV